MNDHNEFANKGHAPNQQSNPSGRPAQAPVYEPPVPLETGPSKLLIGVIGASVLLVGFGVFRMAFAKPADPTPKPQVQSIWSEQQSMMREAMNMAREAQAMQREKMELMRTAIENSEYGMYDEGGFGPDDSDW